MKKILLPTDFSKNAWNAIEYALHFFKDEECLFYLLNAYTPVIYRVDYLVGGPAVSAIPDIGVDMSLSGLERTVEQIKKDYPNSKHRFKTISEFNTLTDEVENTCDKVGVDLIIMGTTGASGAKKIFLGSNTVHIMRKAKVPVLAVPEGFKFKPLKAIIFPTDYLDSINTKDIEPLLELVLKFNAILHVVHAVEDKLTPVQSNHRDLLKALIKDVPNIFLDIIDENMPNIVHSYVEENKIGLVAMLNRKHTFLQRLLFRQNVDSIGYHSSVPFLVLPDTSNY